MTRRRARRQEMKRGGSPCDHRRPPWHIVLPRNRHSMAVIGSICYGGQDPDILELLPLTRMLRGEGEEAHPSQETCDSFAIGGAAAAGWDVEGGRGRRCNHPDPFVLLSSSYRPHRRRPSCPRPHPVLRTAVPVVPETIPDDPTPYLQQQGVLNTMAGPMSTALYLCSALSYCTHDGTNLANVSDPASSKTPPPQRSPRPDGRNISRQCILSMLPSYPSSPSSLKEAAATSSRLTSLSEIICHASRPGDKSRTREHVCVVVGGGDCDDERKTATTMGTHAEWKRAPCGGSVGPRTRGITVPPPHPNSPARDDDDDDDDTTRRAQRKKRMKTYCALGFGDNFFYALGEDSLPIPPDLLHEGEEGEEEGGEGAGHRRRRDIVGRTGTRVSLLPLIHADDAGSTGPDDDYDDDDDYEEEGEGPSRVVPRASSADEWLRTTRRRLRRNRRRRRRQQRDYDDDHDDVAYFASGVVPPFSAMSCGATHTAAILPHHGRGGGGGGDVRLVGTIFGMTNRKFSPVPTRLPLRVVRLSSGRRHVLALTEGAGGGGVGGGVVMSWGAGHFGQLGHGPDVTGCAEPRTIERLLPHVAGGVVIEIAAGGLHSAAIVALSSSKSSSKSSYSKSRNRGGAAASTSGDNNGADVDEGDSIRGGPTTTTSAIVVRETRTFAWGSNRKGQCGVEGGKCATVPEPLPIIAVRREDMTTTTTTTTTTKVNGASNPVDKNVHFEKLSLGRLHTVALTAHGEVFTWGSTSMGRCGHNNGSSLDPPSSGSDGGVGRGGGGGGGDRRFVQQPRHVSALRNVAIESIAAGGAHTLALSRGGRVFAWGAGGDGQCGQGHAGNLFSPRAVQGLAFGSSVMSERDGASTRVANDGKMNERASSRASSTSNTSNSSSVASPEPKSDKVVSIRASGCYSAAITANGDVYTWGYGSGAAIGHPIPSEDESSLLPLIPIIEGNQYSTATAAKVFPEGGSEDNKIRDCRCFDTDLNVMLPRRVECTRALGLFVEDASLGPGHMVMLCSLRGGDSDDNANKNADVGQSLRGGGVRMA
ncbi:hypothetical protein ACHAW5_009189 [Stephanodiscus triporus]|uniref:Uncharacterized protein n=1 Tax=Stephanodiscus triporus TaxID=2934178 RepID=A0ABD3NTM4_9STRA